MSGTPQRRQRSRKGRPFLDDPQVAPQRELEASGDRVPCHRGDDGLREDHTRRAHRSRTFALGSVAAPLAHGDEVRAGAEVPAFPPEDRDARLRVALEGHPNAATSASAVVAIDRVSPLRAREHDRQDGPRSFRPYRHVTAQPLSAAMAIPGTFSQLGAAFELDE